MDKAFWLDALPSRPRNMILTAHDAGDIPSISRGAVRAMGAAYWFRRRGLGAVSVKAISDAVGGFVNATGPMLPPRDFAPWHALRALRGKSTVFDMRTGDKLEEYGIAKGQQLRDLAGHIAQQRRRSVVVYDASCHAWYRVTPNITSPPLPGLWSAVLRQEQAKQDIEYVSELAGVYAELTAGVDELVERFDANPSFEPAIAARVRALADQVRTLVAHAQTLVDLTSKKHAFSKGPADEE